MKMQSYDKKRPVRMEVLTGLAISKKAVAISKL
jgi:hypothetical protein